MEVPKSLGGNIDTTLGGWMEMMVGIYSPSVQNPTAPPTPLPSNELESKLLSSLKGAIYGTTRGVTMGDTGV